MKLNIILLSAATLVAAQHAQADNYVLSTENTSVVIQANQGSEARYKYFGTRISQTDADNLDANQMATADYAYPLFGYHSTGEKPILTQMPDGSLSVSAGITDIQRTSDSEGELLVITEKDRVYPFIIRQYFKAYKGTDVISTWVEYENQGKKPIKLLRYYSANVPLERGDNWATHFHGQWAGESQMSEHPVANGQTVLSNKSQLRNSFGTNPSIMVTLDGKPCEESGRTIGAALLWSGNFKFILDARNNGLTLLAGINDDGAEYILEAKETFKTPALAMAYSTEGKGGVSRAFHRWGRKYALQHGDKLRDILLNSWEGVYMNVNQEVMDQMMGGISSLGGELFVMDDGWFGDKHARNTDKSGLGDWMVNTKKLPQGIGGLTAAAKKHNVKFGIWIEPEMANTESELFEKHPEWILSDSKRPLSKGRGGTQVVLDLSNPKVQDFVFSITDNLLTENPEIAYIKWDANADIMNYNSHYLPADRQQELNVRYHMGLRSVLERIREKYKDVVIQLCASGGGRVGYGLLPYFDEFWASDDTDPVTRLFIQWGDLHFYPAKAMAAHVSASPNHQTGRQTPLKFRFDVAMTGRLGMELQPKNMNDTEKEFAKRAIAAYKDIRPVVQEGDLYRLVSPYDRGSFSSLMYASPDKSHIAFFAYRTSYIYGEQNNRIRLTGVDEGKTYVIRDLTPEKADKPCALNGKRVSGKMLKYVGIQASNLVGRPMGSVALELKAE